MEKEILITLLIIILITSNLFTIIAFLAKPTWKIATPSDDTTKYGTAFIVDDHSIGNKTGLLILIK